MPRDEKLHFDRDCFIVLLAGNIIREALHSLLIASIRSNAILKIMYYMLSEHLSYRDLGGNYFDACDRQATEKSLARRLEKLVYQVELQVAS